MSFAKRLTITALAVVSLALTAFFDRYSPASRLTESAPESPHVATEATAAASGPSSPSLTPPPAAFVARTKSAAAAPEELRQVLPSLTERVANWKAFKPAAITIAPYPDTALEFTATSIREEHGRTIWTGRNAVQGAYLVAAATENEWHATLVIPGASTFEVFISGGNVTLTEKNHDAEICGHGAANAADVLADVALAQADSQPRMAADVENVVDVLFFYDAETLALVDGHAATIATRAISHLEFGNAALQNSDVGNLKWRFAGAYQVPAYAATGEMEEDLRLMGGNGEVARFVAEKSLEHGADQAVLYVGGVRNWAGYALILSNPGNVNSRAHSVARWNTSAFTLVHELGHNFGCRHDRETDEQAFDGDGRYHYGYRFRDGANVEFGTIMSYATKLPYFSNPAVSYRGFVLGVPDAEPKAANNARKLTENAAPMANRREAITAPTITAHPQSATVTRGQRLDLAVTAIGGNLRYQWRKGGVTIPGAAEATFTRIFAADTDAGAYSVTVSNIAGEAASSEATVIVAAPAAGAPAAPAGGGGGGGGAVSGWFLLALALLGFGRFASPRRAQ